MDFQYGQDSARARARPQFLIIKVPSMLLPKTSLLTEEMKNSVTLQANFELEVLPATV